MLSKEMFKGIRSKLCALRCLAALGTVGMGFVRPAQAAAMNHSNANGSYKYRYRLAANTTQTFT